MLDTTTVSACICGASRVSPVVCEECGAIFDVPQDVFALFGLPRSWAVDPTALEDRYLALSRALREKSSARDDLRDRAGETLAAVEAARRMLLDPFDRARQLLVAYGGNEREKPLRKREFQTELMELDRAANRARQEGDSARLRAVVLEAEERLASALVAAGQSFTRLERSIVDELNAAADALAEARGWQRKVDELRAALKS